MPFDVILSLLLALLTLSNVLLRHSVEGLRRDLRQGLTVQWEEVEEQGGDE